MAKAMDALVLQRDLQGERDLQGAWDWLLKAAEAGLPEAVLQLARLAAVYIDDNDEQLKWLGKAAEVKNPEAMLDLSRIAFRDGNHLESTRWLNDAVQYGGNPVLVEVSGVALLQGDRDKALELLTRGAGLYQTEAMLKLSEVLEDSDPESAAAWLRKAAEAEDPWAMYLMGCSLYRAGDISGADRWWRYAEEAGVCDANVGLSVLHEIDTKDRWRLRNARVPEGINDRDFLYQMGEVAEERGETAAALIWYESSAAAGLSQAGRAAKRLRR
jgi:TPR repeat protein